MLKEIFIDSLVSIWLNRKRVILLILSICLSVWMIIIIFSLKSAVQDVIYVFLSNEYAVTQSVTCKIMSENFDDSRYGLTKEEINLIEKNLPSSCKNIVVKSNTELTGIILNGGEQKATVNGVSNGYFECMKIELIEGRFLEEKDYSGNFSSVIISDVVAKNCFGSVDNAIGSKLIFLEEQGLSMELHIIGVYRDKNIVSKRESSSLSNYNTIIYCTDNFIDNLERETDLKYTTFYVVLNDINEIENVAFYMEKNLRNRFLENGDYIVKVYGLDLFEDMYDIIDIIVFIFMIIIVIVFFVSGISIMNVMLVSVRRRTREIGIQKALGEKSGWIKLQFVLESIFIGLFGETVGVFMGYVSILTISKCLEICMSQLITEEVFKMFVGNVDFFPDAGAILISMAYCLCTSITFGLIPANKAASLVIVDALRFKN